MVAARGPAIRIEWRWFWGIACLTLAGILTVHQGSFGTPGSGREDLISGVLAWLLVSAITAFSLILRHGTWVAVHPSIASLGTTALRLLVILPALAITTATKWNAGNSFARYLLGCYFIFLVLESWLSARWYSSRSHDLPS